MKLKQAIYSLFCILLAFVCIYQYFENRALYVSKKNTQQKIQDLSKELLKAKTTLAKHDKGVQSGAILSNQDKNVIRTLREELQDLRSQRVKKDDDINAEAGTRSDEARLLSQLFQAWEKKMDTNPSDLARIDFQSFIVRNGLTTKISNEELDFLWDLAATSDNSHLLIGLASFSNDEEGLEHLRNSVNLDPANIRANLAIAEKFVDDDNFNLEFDNAINAAQNLDPNNSYPYYMEAMKKIKEGDSEVALNAFDKAMLLDHFDTHRLQEIATREALLKNAGYSRGPAKYIAVIGSVNLSTIALQNDFVDKLIDIAKRTEENGEMVKAEKLYRGISQLGSRYLLTCTTTIEEVNMMRVKQSALKELSRFYQSNGDYEKQKQMDMALTHINKRRQKIRDTQVNTSSEIKEYMIHLLEDENAFAEYFDNVLKYGELGAQELVLKKIHQ